MVNVFETDEGGTDYIEIFYYDLESNPIVAPVELYVNETKITPSGDLVIKTDEDGGIRFTNLDSSKDYTIIATVEIQDYGSGMLIKSYTEPTQFNKTDEIYTNELAIYVKPIAKAVSYIGIAFAAGVGLTYILKR